MSDWFHERLAAVPWRIRRRVDRSVRRFLGKPDGPLPEEYRDARRAQLARCRDLSKSIGLEIGAGDLPTVRPDEGTCAFADFRSPEELASTLGFDDEQMEPLSYVIDRDKPLSQQILRRFDYIVLCHVLEHVAEPIRYLEDLTELLYPGGHILIALPDKRQTGDLGRPSTRLEELLDVHYRELSRPTLKHVLEMSQSWSEEIAMLAQEDPRAYYEFGAQQVASPEADAHCNVWIDHEFFSQLSWLIRGGFVGPVSIERLDPTHWPFNEFHAVLRRDDDLVGDPEGKIVRAPRSSEWGGHLFLVDEGRKRWLTSPQVRTDLGLDDAPVWLVREAVLDAIPFGPPLEASGDAGPER